MFVVLSEPLLEAHPEFAGDLTLQDVAKEMVLNRRIAHIGNLQHDH
jgi:hypothetical protein